MKKLLFILIAFLFIANISAYAFENKYFSVSDKGWVIQKESDTHLTFILPKDKSKTELGEDDEGDIFINIRVKKTEDDDKDEKEFYYREFNQEELEDWKAFCQGYYKLSLEEEVKEMEEENTEDLKKKYPNLTPEERKQVLTKFVNDNSEMGKMCFKEIGNHTAKVFEYKINEDTQKYIEIVTLNREYEILVFYYVPLENNEYYKDFIKSLNIKDKKATKINSYLHAYFWWIIAIPLIIVEIIVKIKRKKMQSENV